MNTNQLILNTILSISTLIIAKIIIWLINQSIEKIDAYAERKGLSALDITDDTKRAISQFIKYIIYSASFMIILYIFNLNDLLAGILTAAGVTGIAIGFAAKDLISNALSGIILIFDRPFKIGDYVKIGRFIEKGTIKSIGIRKTVIESRDGLIITVPNSKILSETVTNLTKAKRRLVELTIELDIDTNIKKALQLIDKELDKIAWKYKNESEVYVSDVNKDNVILTIKVWIASKKYGERKTELFYKIRDLLKKNKIKSSIIR